MSKNVVKDVVVETNISGISFWYLRSYNNRILASSDTYEDYIKCRNIADNVAKQLNTVVRVVSR